ncbi:hypothetical protein Patl1_32034 [Pistacia atlantica]|uniref:Uncharacterized protein n=1 Tax=Pistacia atlantica TaxID=434234 RepID=A0ACC1AN99_9ROSI|nr:hypothetical protein Patl1_32034 [Pistacia atlantica]
MNLTLPSSSASSSSSPISNPFPITHTLPLHWVSSPPHPSSITTSKPSRPFRLQTTNSTSTDLSLSNPSSNSPSPSNNFNDDQALLTLLRQRKTEEAWIKYTQSTHLPNPTCLSRLVSQLSYQSSILSLSRAQSIVTRLRHERLLHRLDANSLGLLAVAAAKSGHTLYASSIIKSMLRSSYLPHVKAWSAVVSRLAASADDGPTEAIKLFDSVVRRVRKFSDPTIVSDSRPDTAAYNAVLNACANLGNTKKFLQLFNRMSEFGSEPDVLTYNVMIKLCARAGRKNLLVFVLERILEMEIPLCMTTLHSLVAAYVGFGDLEMAENMVQAMREGRRDLCRILRDLNFDDLSEDSRGNEGDEDVFEKLLPNSISPSSEPPLLSKVYAPNSRIYTTLMKGYMNEGIAPTKVSYTTLMKAFALSGQPKLARKVFDEMVKDPRVKVDLVAWNMLIEGHCRMGFIEEAKRLVQRMKEEGFYPNVATYGSLANGISLARKPGEALLLWKEVKERCEVKMEGMKSDSDSLPPLKPDEGLLDALADVCVRAAFFKKALEIIACMEENGIPPNKTKYKKIYVEMHSRMFTSKHASQARQDRRKERKRAAEAFKFWLGLPNSYYGSEWRLEPTEEDDYLEDDSV